MDARTSSLPNGRTDAVHTTMRKFIIVALAAIAAYVAFDQRERPAAPLADAGSPPSVAAQKDAISTAYERRESNVQVEGAGVVVRVLSDDNDGSKHQRFIVELASGQTVLISHNIDLAPRVAPLASGDRVQFSGEYEWNNKGGVVHWTHHDPAGRRPGGWIRRGGETFR
jgi:hypothetical protein